MDIWALGVVLYEMLVGVSPFMDANRDLVFDRIRNLQMEWPPIGDGEDEMSENAQDLIIKMLTKDKNSRLGYKSMQDVKDHPFFEGMDWEKLADMDPPYIPRRDDPDYPRYSNFQNFLSDDFEVEEWDSVLERFFVTKNETIPHHADELLENMKNFDMTRFDLLHNMNLKKSAEITKKLKNYNDEMKYCIEKISKYNLITKSDITYHFHKIRAAKIEAEIQL